MSPIPIGFCQCGCGQKTPLAKRNSKSRDARKWKKGEPMLFISGHNKARLSKTPYIVDPKTGCWVWQLSLNNQGYSTLKRDGRQWLGHRWYYEQAKGKIPAGIQIDHLCRNRKCVNPDHLEVVTASTNIRRTNGLAAERARRTHCPQGHAYTPQNTYVSPSGTRRCRKCNLDLQNRRYEAKKRKGKG